MQDLWNLNDHLTSESQLIEKTINNWISADVIPEMAQAYENHVFPQAFIKQMADMGLFGLTLPEEYGCAGASHQSYGVACQALERGDSGVRSFVSVQSSLCMFPIFSFGSDEQKRHWLPAMAKGEAIGAFALTEPDSGSDPSSMTTKADKIGSGWRLNGTKMWITNGPICDVAIVWAQTADGIRGFLVPKETPGFTRIEMTGKLSLRASITGELVFKDCELPEEAMLPMSTDGLVCALKCLTKARYGISWGAIGAAMQCFEVALDYSKERIQFGKPIASFQLVQKDLATMYNEIVKAQLMNLQLANLMDDDKCSHFHVSMAKMNSCRQALKIARMCRNLLGANGIMGEYQIMRHLANLETVFTYEGTDNIHHLIVGKQLTGLSAFS